MRLVRPRKDISFTANGLDAATRIVINIKLASKATYKHVETAVQRMIVTLEYQPGQMFARQYGTRSIKQSIEQHVLHLRQREGSTVILDRPGGFIEEKSAS